MKKKPVIFFLWHTNIFIEFSPIQIWVLQYKESLDIFTPQIDNSVSEVHFFFYLDTIHLTYTLLRSRP